MLHDQFPAGGQFKLQEVKDAMGDPDRICREFLVEHRKGLDADRGEPFLPGRIVLADQLDPLMDLIKVKLSIISGLRPRGLDRIMPAPASSPHNSVEPERGVAHIRYESIRAPGRSGTVTERPNQRHATGRNYISVTGDRDA